MAGGTNRRGIELVDRRVGLLFGVFLLLLTAGLLRATYLGLFRSGALRAAAAEEHVQTVTIPAVGGTITDRNGMVLALSESADQIIGDPLLIASPPPGTPKISAQTIAAKLSPLLHVPVQTLLSELTKPNDGSVNLAQVPAATGARIAAMNINGISETPVDQRAYPRGSEAAQLLGWLAATRKASGGLQYLYYNQLAGVPGVRRIVNAATGQPISVDTPKPMVPGKPIQLTIDARLQMKVEQVLAGVGHQYHPKGATAIVMNPDNDQVLAMASWPTFNPNRPLTNRILQNNTSNQAVDLAYEPGSTFKAVAVSGALQDGLVSPSTNFTIPPYLDYYGKLIHDAETHGYETLSVAQILKVSSNIGADLIARKLGARRFDYWVRRFGFGKLTGIDLPGESQGVVPHWWQYSGLSMGTLPFGQGLEVTPIQLATAYSAIANGGILRSPRIVEKIGSHVKPEPRGVRIISPQVASEVRDMLRGVLADGGTASGAAIPGYDLAGKTGTANIAVNGKYSNTQFMASFVGMVPASDPKLVIAVVVDDPRTGTYGGTVAAPAFQKIVGWAVPYFGINPCPSPCPPSALNPAMPSTP